MENEDRFLDHLAPLLILTLIFFVNFIARIIPAPLMPMIETDLNISHAQSGSFFLLISSGFFTTLICSAFVSSRFTHRQTIIFSCIALGLTLLGTSFSQGLWGIRLALFSVGMGSGLYLPSAIASLTTITSSKHWGKAIAIHELAPNLSFVAAPLICEFFLIWFSWRSVFVFLGFAALLLTGVFFRYGKGGDFCGQAPSYSSFKQIFPKPEFWVFVVLFSLGISATMGLYNMLPLYLVNEHGMDRQAANTLLAFSRLAGIGMSLVGGWVTDRFGPKRVLMVVFFLTGIMTIFIGTTSTSGLAVSIFIQPMAAVCFFPAGLSALSLTSSKKERSLLISLTVSIAFLLGGGVVPTLIGFVGDIHTFSFGIMLVGGLILTGPLFTSFLRLDRVS